MFEVIVIFAVLAAPSVDCRSGLVFDLLIVAASL